MTIGFNKWSKDKVWWKTDTPDTIETYWKILHENGWHKDDISEMMDNIIAAIRSEYGE